MVKIERLSMFKELNIQIRNLPCGQKFKFLWRKGWLEAPAVMASLPFALIGITLAIYSSKFMYHEGMWKYAKYREHYTIYRSTDPEVKKLQHTSGTD